jgi:outer membrane lipoprotein-sorting protein
MSRFLIIIFILNFYNPSFSSIKENIVSQLKITNNLSFDFIQTINKKNENGKCIIKYPKKIWCAYDNSKKKIIVSDGKSLVIKNFNSGSYYIYPLKKTPLEFLLDKEYLVSKIDTLKSKEVDNKYIHFKILENNSEINIFFNKDDFNLVGWQTIDVYQNLSITFISSVKINQVIDDDFFVLPKK